MSADRKLLNFLSKNGTETQMLPWEWLDAQIQNVHELMLEVIWK
jgi:hypothetical protein